MSIKLKIKYPKFLLFLLTFVLAYFLFKGNDIINFNRYLLDIGYLGVFLAGAFFAYGFTAAPATALLLILSKNYNIILAGLIAGLGSLVADLIIFNFIRHSFADEIETLSKEKIMISVNQKVPLIVRKYLVPVIAGFIIASPLPDEIGVSLFAASRNIPTKIFSIISYILNTIGIFVILFIGQSL